MPAATPGGPGLCPTGPLGPVQTTPGPVGWLVAGRPRGAGPQQGRQRAAEPAAQDGQRSIPPATPVVILGIDPGLARVGYGVIEVAAAAHGDPGHGRQQLLDCGIIRTDPGRSEGARMVEIAADLRLLIRRWRPDLAVVEKFFFYRSSTTIAVVQARGVVIMTLARFGIAVLEFPPMQIKQALTGDGHADKPMVLEAVMRELDLDRPPRPDDAADALAAALTGWFQR